MTDRSVGDTTGHDECNTRPDNVCHSTHADPVTTQPTPVGGHFIDGRWHGCDPNYCDLDHGVAPPAQPQPTECTCLGDPGLSGHPSECPRSSGPDFVGAVAKIRALHQPSQLAAVSFTQTAHSELVKQEPKYCEHDGFVWPCPTVAILNEAGCL